MLGHGLEDCVGHINIGCIVPLSFRRREQAVSQKVNMGAVSWSVFDFPTELRAAPFVPGALSLFCLTLIYNSYQKFGAFPLPHIVKIPFLDCCSLQVL